MKITFLTYAGPVKGLLPFIEEIMPYQKDSEGRIRVSENIWLN